jgi:endogenous inhibitor of DNA gyrase (YacG/DUF329 family)
LRKLADETGGRFFFAPRGDQLKELYRLIAEQLQKEYAVDFNSPRPLADGTQRRVKVTVTMPNGETKTAEGLYVAGFLFNRIRADWIVGALLGLLLLTMGVAPTVGKMALNALAGPQPPTPVPQPPPTPTPVPGAQCPHCGRAVRVGARFCPYCARPIGAAPPAPPPPAVIPPPAAAAMLRCPQCGKPVRAGAKFCGSCRRKLN